MATWMKISYALALGLMLFIMLPRARAMIKNSPKAKPGDWRSVLLPLVVIVLFILLLIQLVR